jgi:membrane-bound metal-dependent hydrolase YbcI (DUF457 family)
MAGFKTHITTSTILGVGYGATAYLGFDMPLDKCMVAAGLCSVSGMLPDLDSDSGVPVRETSAFAAALIPMLMIERFQQLGLSAESMVLAAMLIYIVVRFGVTEIFKRYTVHRGMWHSLPAAATVTLLTFLICQCPEITTRMFKAGGVCLGFMSHLVLDEIYSVERKGVRVRLKKSFGTAIKFWGKGWWPNISTYGKLAVVIMLVLSDPIAMKHLDPDGSVAEKIEPEKEAVEHAEHTAKGWFNELMNNGGSLR